MSALNRDVPFADYDRPNVLLDLYADEDVILLDDDAKCNANRVELLKWLTHALETRSKAMYFKTFEPGRL